MGLIYDVMLAIGLIFSGLILLSFVGAVSLESDKAKANRYLANLHDRDLAE